MSAMTKQAFRLAPRHPPGPRKLIGAEAALQIVVVEHLHKYAVRNTIYFHISNEGLRSQLTAPCCAAWDCSKASAISM